MTYIYLITTFEKMNGKCEYGYLDVGDRRSVGWFPTFKGAERRVKNNTCDLAPITDEAMIGQTKNLLNFHLAKFETDHNTGILSQYYTYYDSIACIQSIVGDNTDLCNLILTPANNE